MNKIFYKHKIENLINIQKLVTIHYFEYDKNFSFSGETHNFWEILYADKNDIITYRENEKIILNQGEIIFYKPNEFHSLFANGKTDANAFIITFECKSEAMKFFYGKHLVLPENLRPLLQAIIEEARATFNLPAFDPDMTKLVLNDNPNLGGQQIIRTCLEMLLIMIMRYETQKHDSSEIFIQQDNMPHNLVNNIIDYLKNNIYGSLSLDDLCLEFHYGKTHLCRSFKKATGKTIFSYYTSLKINEAKKLIKKKKYTFSKISEMLLFDNPAYFSSVFKKYTKMTPKQYYNSINN